MHGELVHPCEHCPQGDRNCHIVVHDHVTSQLRRQLVQQRFGFEQPRPRDRACPPSPRDRRRPQTPARSMSRPSPEPLPQFGKAYLMRQARQLGDCFKRVSRGPCACVLFFLRGVLSVLAPLPFLFALLLRAVPCSLSSPPSRRAGLAAVILGPVLALLLFAVLDGRLDHFFHIDVRHAVFLGGTLS